MPFLTETASYDEPGSWGPASASWPEIFGPDAYSMYVFANCAPSIPYGSYFLISPTRLRVEPSQQKKLLSDWKDAGRPLPAECLWRRGQARKAKKWW